MTDEQPKIAIVSSAELAVPGNPLTPDYYVNRRDGETYADYQRRMKIEDLERRAADHLRHATRLHAEARKIREGGE